MKKRLAMLGASAVLMCGGLGGAQPAAAAEPGTVVCEAYTGGVRNLSVVQTGARTFDVTFVDINILGALNTAVPDAFLTMPAEIRYGTNTVTVPTGVEITGISLSQSVVTGPNLDPGPDDADWVVDSFLGNPSAPGESATVVSNVLTWVHDTDFRSDAAGVQVVPSDFPPSPFPPGSAFNFTAAQDDASSVLQFTLTVPNAVSGDNVVLIEDFVGTVYRHGYTDSGWIIDVGEEMTDVGPGCSVALAALPVDVTPVAPTLTPGAACDIESTVTIPTTTGVTYAQSRVGNIVTVTATADQGYSLADGATTSWTFDVTPETKCATPVEPVEPTPTTTTTLPGTGSGALPGTGSGTLPGTGSGVLPGTGSGTLPATGFEAGPIYLGLGALLLATGSGLLVIGRKRQRA